MVAGFPADQAGGKLHLEVPPVSVESATLDASGDRGCSWLRAAFNSTSQPAGHRSSEDLKGNPGAAINSVYSLLGPERTAEEKELPKEPDSYSIIIIFYLKIKTHR